MILMHRSYSVNKSGKLIIRAIFFVIIFYLILILSIFTIIAVGVGLVIILYNISAKNLNIIPANLLFLIVIGAFLGVFAIIKAIFYSIFKKTPFEPAYLIKKDEAPVLCGFIVNLCNKMNSKQPDSIILHAEPTFFVKQGKLNVFNGKAKGRILAIGLPMIGLMTANELRAVLAHEFAHFTGKDTTYSSYVLPVYNSTINAIENMNVLIKNRGTLVSLPVMLPYYCLNGFLKKFHVYNMKNSREREKRADLIAASICGSQCFSNALKKVVVFSEIFMENSQFQITEMIKKQKKYKNYYNVFRNLIFTNTAIINEYEDLFLKGRRGRMIPILRYIPD